MFLSDWHPDTEINTNNNIDRFFILIDYKLMTDHVPAFYEHPERDLSIFKKEYYFLIILVNPIIPPFIARAVAIYMPEFRLLRSTLNSFSPLPNKASVKDMIVLPS